MQGTLNKPWRVAVPMTLGTGIGGKFKKVHPIAPRSPQKTTSHLPRQHTLPGYKRNILMCFISPLPSCMDLTQQHIDTPPRLVVYSCTYWLPLHKRVVWDKLKAKVDWEVISSWCRSVFCVDYSGLQYVNLMYS